MFASTGAVLLGLLLGLRHAFEPDHLAAVSTLVTEAGGARRGALLGALWGLGHTASLAIVGGVLLVAGASLPARAAAGFELAVAAMLIVLGLRAIVRAPDELPPPPRGRSFAIGAVHGLAGSGALTALAFAALPGTAARLTYIVLFGAGSIAGMAIASGVAGATIGRAAITPRARRGFAISTGAIAIAVGVAWGVPMLRLL